MKNKGLSQDSVISRRRFITAAAATAVTAAAVGGGAALIKEGSPQAAQATFIVNDLAPPVAAAVPAANQAPDLFAQLATAQADNVRLQVALDAAQSQLAALAQNGQESVNSSEQLQLQLGQANNQIGILGGLIALYEQMDLINFEGLFASGAEQVSARFVELIDDIPTLNESIAAGRNALQEMDDNIPLLQNGRSWVKNQIGLLQTYFSGIESLLQQAVDNIGPLLVMLNNWFADVKKWLPFGMGEKAANIMGAITTLIIETPQTISGLEANIVLPLDDLLAENAQGAVPLRQNLIYPLQSDVLDKTSATLGKAQEAESSFTTKLKEPLQAATTSQRLIRELIVQYRQKHQI